MQRILVVQQNRNGDAKIAGLQRRGRDLLLNEIVDITAELPSIIDDTSELLTTRIDADLVLSFLEHPDLVRDLALICRDAGVPLIASGQKLDVEGAHTPPT